MCNLVSWEQAGREREREKRGFQFIQILGRTEFNSDENLSIF